MSHIFSEIIVLVSTLFLFLRKYSSNKNSLFVSSISFPALFTSLLIGFNVKSYADNSSELSLFNFLVNTLTIAFIFAESSSSLKSL